MINTPTLKKANISYVSFNSFVSEYGNISPQPAANLFTCPAPLLTGAKASEKMGTNPICTPKQYSQGCITQSTESGPICMSAETGARCYIKP